MDVAAIEQINPHRGPMRLLDGVAYLSDDQHDMVSFHDVREDEFWCEGHIPGRPIFPGVLMVEAAAQAASIQAQRIIGELGFIGFAGVDDVKFRGQVKPLDRFILLSRMISVRRRRCIALAQGVVNGTLVFEGKITGMPL